MPSLSRFTQLFLICSLVIFLPTFLYLRPGSSTSMTLPSGLGTQSSQGHGVVSSSNESNWKWPGEKWLEPGKLKAGDYWSNWKNSFGGSSTTNNKVAPSTNVVQVPEPTGGQAFATKMANATAKAELGRSTWKFLHTMTLRFPDNPTSEQRETLSQFFSTFSLLYPCGDCANHFQKLLKQYPPQTSSRMSASLWLCSVHNMVNQRLGKEEFECDKLDSTYDCGCGPTSTSNITSATLLPAGPQARQLSHNQKCTRRMEKRSPIAQWNEFQHQHQQ
ncbi:unnamed protein product [Sympodiomycopsis kandeliae]